MELEHQYLVKEPFIALLNTLNEYSEVLKYLDDQSAVIEEGGIQPNNVDDELLIVVFSNDVDEVQEAISIACIEFAALSADDFRATFKVAHHDFKAVVRIIAVDEHTPHATNGIRPHFLVIYDLPDLVSFAKCQIGLAYRNGKGPNLPEDDQYYMVRQAYRAFRKLGYSVEDASTYTDNKDCCRLLESGLPTTKAQFQQFIDEKNRQKQHSRRFRP